MEVIFQQKVNCTPLDLIYIERSAENRFDSKKNTAQ